MSINWENIYKKYKGLWVALEDDETTVVASGKTAKEALQKARNHGYVNPILARMPKELMPYVGFNLYEV